MFSDNPERPERLFLRGETTMTQQNILLESGTNELEIIEFFIAEEDAQGNSYTGYYGMNVAKVLEIIRKPDVTGMPNKHHRNNFV